MIQGFSGGLLNRELIYNLDLPSFQRDFASLKTLDHGTGPAITFERLSGATFFDANGDLQTAANDVARFDHSQDGAANSLGLLIEETRTNSLRNSQGGGAVVGAPGTLPTHQTVSLTATGISREIVAIGTLNGFNHIDLRLSGTNTSGSAGSVQVLFEATTRIVASTGQNWSASAYIALVAGSFDGVTNSRLVVTERSSAGAALASHNVAITAATATLQRFAVSATLAQATASRVTSSIIGSIAIDATIDITLRIAAPQLELGAFPTSYIPTTTATATRSADSAVVTPIDSFYNQVEGTLFAEVQESAADTLYGIVSVNNNSGSNRVDLRRPGATNMRALITTAGAEQASLSPLLAQAGQTFKIATAFKVDDAAVSLNGATSLTDSSVTVPTVTHLRIGGLDANPASTATNGHIRKLAYFPKRLSNTLLEQLTT